MQQKRKIPMRMCSGCGRMMPKSELVRIVRAPEGEVSLDLTGKKSGRGAYICRSVECLKAARKKRRFEHSFGCAIDKEVYDAMEKELTVNE